MINFSKIAKEELDELIKMFPDYKLGEILYSFLRFSGEKVNWLLEVTDQDLYAMLEKAKKTEKDEG